MIACIVIASAKRLQLWDELVLPSVLAQQFSEVVVVGDYHSGEGYRHIPFASVTGTTVDALFKRDVGTVATSCEQVFYLCDDHRISVCAMPRSESRNDIIVPGRFCERAHETVVLNMGAPDYCGGHGGIFPRAAIRAVPWSAAPWHPNWDYLHSRMLADRGFAFRFMDSAVLIQDVDSNGEPWK